MAEIYNERVTDGWENIVVLGDLNDTPDSEPVCRRRVSGTPARTPLTGGEREGTFSTGNEKIDCLLLSPALFGKINAGGVDRKGVWHPPGSHNPWQRLPTLTKEIEAASDHAAVWVELDL